MSDTSFRRFGGVCAILLAICGVAYALLLLADTGAPGLPDRLTEALSTRSLNRTASLVLALAGLLTTAGVATLHGLLKAAGREWARWAAGLGLVGGAMTAAHGYWDFARVPVLLAQWNTAVDARREAISAFAGVPNPADPRGLGALLFVGVFVLVAARLVLAGKTLPALVGQIGLVYGALLVLAFLSGLAGPDAVRSALTGLAVGVAGPVWWLLVGRELLRA